MTSFENDTAIVPLLLEKHHPVLPCFPRGQEGCSGQERRGNDVSHGGQGESLILPLSVVPQAVQFTKLIKSGNRVA